MLLELGINENEFSFDIKTSLDVAENDFGAFISYEDKKAGKELCVEYKDFIIFLANLLYRIELDDRDKKLLWKSLRKNEDMLKSMSISKKDFSIDIMDVIFEVLKFRYEMPYPPTPRE